MDSLTLSQLILVLLIFVWSGFVRTGLGFCGAKIALSMLLLVDNRSLAALPIITVHLLIFSTVRVLQNNRACVTSR